MGLVGTAAGVLGTFPASPGVVVIGAVLLASFLHATWNLLAKAMRDQVVAFGLINGTAALYGGIVLVVVEGPSRASLPYLATSVGIHVAYNIALLNSYRFGDLSQVYPLARGIAPLLVTGGAAVFAGEVLAPWQIAGVAVVAGGLTSLVWARGQRSLDDRRALLLALATGVTIAAYSLVDGLGVRRSANPLGYAGALFLAEGLVVALLVVYVRRHTLRAGADRTWALGIAGGVLSVAAYSLVLWAQTRAALATVSRALRETSIVVAALLGTIFLREGSARRRVIAALIVTAGVVLIVAG